MVYREGFAGRVDPDPSVAGRVTDPRRDNGLLRFEDVEARLIEAVMLWRRSPGGGRSPFAADGPWDLITERTRAEAGGGYIGRGEVEQVALRRLPLTRAEVAERDEASALVLLAPERDRRLVVAVVMAKAAERRIRWSDIRRRLGAGGIGERGLGMRYTRAIGAIVKAVNGRHGG